MPKQWFCDCEKHCKGTVKEVSRSTYQRHAGFRKPDFPDWPPTAESETHTESRFGPDRTGARAQTTRVFPQALGSTGPMSDRDASGGGALGPVHLNRLNAQDHDSSIGNINNASGGALAPAQIDPNARDQDDSLIGNINNANGGGPAQIDLNAQDQDDSSIGNVNNASGGTPAHDQLEGDSSIGNVSGMDEAIADPGSLDDDSENRNQESTPPGSFDLDELSDIAKLKDIKMAMEFIKALREATLDGPYSHLDSKTLERLRNPPRSSPIIDPDLRLGLDLFLASNNASQKTYIASREAILRRHPEDEVPSYDQMKRRIAEITGAVPIIHHMCKNSCAAFTGPFEELTCCPECGEERYESSGVPKQEFFTIPLGPLLQALYRDLKSAKDMSYRRMRTREIIRELQENNGFLKSFGDFLHGREYLEAIRRGHITDNSILLMLSIDGAQLYAHKSSDCWICIWVVFEQAPEIRYKVKHVLPAFTIPGPHKPKIMDSYLFPSLYHLSALQREGLPIWDAQRNVIFESQPFFALGTADGPAMAYLNGLVGHHGKLGCRLYCSLIGRHKPGGSHYYPAFFKPLGYNVEGCDHDDISYAALPKTSLKAYHDNLRYLMASPNESQYKKRRLETGISKPSIFLGLSENKSLPVPSCFGSDIMHLLSLNIPDLLINLWRGTLDCDKNDDRTTWDWAVLKGPVWEKHGRQVASATPYLPGSFDRPPRNPAEKISSGYKAWEFLLYLFGLGPGLLYNVLPEKYWRNFCKLVYGVRIVNQHEIKVTDLQKAQIALLEFACEFELLYYQRRTDRLHFVRQSIHGVAHLATEVTRLGPATCSSQWTMERTIGNLGQEIRQPSNPFKNLSQRALLRCQVNSLKAMIPDLETSPDVPRGAKELGGGYILLRAKDRTSRAIPDSERQALVTYLNDNHNGVTIDADWYPLITRWGRLRLPNGQVARSSWKEKSKPLQKVRMARNIKIQLEGQDVQFAEIYYFFQMVIGDSETEKSLAMVSMYSPPHAGLLTLSFNTLWSCTYQGDLSLRVIDAKSIAAVIAMVPHQPFPEDSSPIERFFVIEKPGLDVSSLAGVTESAPEEE